MRKVNFNMIVCALGLSSAVACAHAPPQELVEARQAYHRASTGLAARLAPADLDTAKTALAKAENLFQEEPDAANTRDWAYVAARKAQLAEVKAALEASNQKKIAGRAQVETAMKDKITSTKEDLASSRRANEDAKDQLATERADASKEALEAEKKARVAAEEQTRDLAERLAQTAKVTEEARGTVISLSGSVLFASGQSVLLSGASRTLDDVAAALDARRAQTLAVTIEGHTDSLGSEAMNQALSLARGRAVRDYLIARGVQASLLTAVGLGETRPIEDNATAEGRANNRRVEIILRTDRS